MSLSVCYKDDFYSKHESSNLNEYLKILRVSKEKLRGQSSEESGGKKKKQVKWSKAKESYFGRQWQDY